MRKLIMAGSFREMLEEKYQEEEKKASRYRLWELAETMMRKNSTSFDCVEFKEKKKAA